MEMLLLCVLWAGFGLAGLGVFLKRWFPRAGVSVGLFGFVVAGAGLLMAIGNGLLDGRVRNYGFGTGEVLHSESPAAFWGLIVFWLLVGAVVIAGSVWALRRHLELKSSPAASHDDHLKKRLGL